MTNRRPSSSRLLKAGHASNSRTRRPANVTERRLGQAGHAARMRLWTGNNGPRLGWSRSRFPCGSARSWVGAGAVAPAGVAAGQPHGPDPPRTGQTSAPLRPTDGAISPAESEKNRKESSPRDDSGTECRPDLLEPIPTISGTAACVVGFRGVAYRHWAWLPRRSLPLLTL